MNKVLTLAINNVLMMLVVPVLTAEHVRGVKMTVTICNQGYQARVPKDGHHPHVLLLFKDLIEVISQARTK
jgi:hypothetical protein